MNGNAGISDQLREGVIAIARDAAAAILDIYDSEFAVQHKDDNSPLTAADMAAHHCIIDGLALLTPDIPVLSEESAHEVSAAQRRPWSRLWVVDPLDGTREFIKRNGEFTVNIALIENHRPVMGVVYAPVLDLLFFAASGQGAFKQSDNMPPQAIHVRKYDAAQITIAGSRSHAGEELRHFLDRIGPHVLISMGSSLKICMVAEGQADVYPRLGLTSEWDTAAAQCVVESAGGRVTDLDGQPLRYNKPDILNPWFLATGAGEYDWHALLGHAG